MRITEKYADKFITFCSVDVSGIAEPGFESYVRRELKESFKKGIRALNFLKTCLCIRRSLPMTRG